jgi:hypothetical protein
MAGVRHSHGADGGICEGKLVDRRTHVSTQRQLQIRTSGPNRPKTPALAPILL